MGVDEIIEREANNIIFYAANKGAQAIIKHFKSKIGIPLFSEDSLRLEISDILKEKKKYVAEGIIRKITK